MNSTEIENFIETNSCLRGHFRGVFAINTLPRYVTIYPSAFIVNTEPMPLPGEHWILIIIYSKQNAIFFDSFGRPPSYYGFDGFLNRNSSHVQYINEQLQAKNSNYCGFYVLFVLIMLVCKQFTLTEVYSFFTSNVLYNDNFVHSFISRCW